MKKRFVLFSFVLGLFLLAFALNPFSSNASVGGGSSEWCDEDYECCREGTCCVVVKPTRIM